MKPSEFLTLLWGQQPPGLIQLWRLADRRSSYMSAPDAADVIAAGVPDVYTGVATTAKDRGAHHRAKVSEAAAIAGFWIDLDVNGGPGDKQGAAPNLDAALVAARAVLEPTIIVGSGYGAHAWWLFDEPWIFATTDERDQAQLAMLQWYELHRRQVDWTIDGTHDLARLLRLPGTANAKGPEPRPVEILEHAGGRYPRQQLLDLAATAGDVQQPTIGRDVDVSVGGFIDKPTYERLATRAPMFARTWQHQRPEHPEWSMSEYDLALCSIAALNDWTDQQLADLIATHRLKYGDTSGKASRPDYVQRTIALARQAATPPADANDRLSTLNPEEWALHILDMLQREDDGAIPVPFYELNEALDGGLRPGEVCLVAGYTSHGKSIYVDMIADRAAEHGRRVHLYMTEMSAYQRGLRLLARRSPVKFRKLKRRELDGADWKHVADALKDLSYGCSIVSDWTVDQVVDHIRENQWDVAVIDLIHGFHYLDERDLSKTSSALVRAAKGSATKGHPGTAIVAAAHLNDGQMRDSRSPIRPRPGLHSIKGSSSLKQDADVVMFVWQQDDEDGMPSGKGAIWIAKCRQGELASVKVAFDLDRFQFVPSNWTDLEEVAA